MSRCYHGSLDWRKDIQRVNFQNPHLMPSQLHTTEVSSESAQRPIYSRSTETKLNLALEKIPINTVWTHCSVCRMGSYIYDVNRCSEETSILNNGGVFVTSLTKHATLSRTNQDGSVYSNIYFFSDALNMNKLLEGNTEAPSRPPVEMRNNAGTANGDD